MSTRQVNYTRQHRLYVRSAEFSARWRQWRDTKGNLGPFALTIYQAHLFAVLAGIPSAAPVVIVVALWLRWWISRRPRAPMLTRAWWKPLPPVCRAHGWPSLRGLLAKVQYHHTRYRALDAVIDAGGDMANPYDRAKVAALERNCDGMALCEHDHEVVEWLLKVACGLTGRSKKRLRRVVSWGWVLTARTLPAAFAALVLKEFFRNFL